VFGIGVVSAVAFACSGSAFKSSSGELEHGGSDTGNGGDVDLQPHAGRGSTGGKSGTTTGGATGEPEGGATTIDPLSPAGSSAGGTGHMAGTDGVGGSVVPPDQGNAGEPNIPDPPLDPDCAAPIQEGWTEALSPNASWYAGFGDPHVDTANHRLVLSYDDVAERTQPYEGSYYMQSEVTLEGGTVFTPYPYTFEVFLPSLRRNAAGTGIELGATEYGPSSWTATGWGAASGSTIAGATKLTVALYLQATSKAFAVKVSSGNKVYRSAWVTDFHWAQTNLGIMRYVGENNSGVYHGGSDKIYVSPVSGCQKLSDAAVQARFEN
jgi:hypothetical protein